MGEIRRLKSSKAGDPPRESTPPRRLAAIVAGDIAGYSRLMQIDEEGTHLRVKRIERDLIEPSIAGHHGRLVKTTGDGFIAIFDSPVEAVRCGIVIQQNMVGRNASMPKHHWIEYRIGVNLGDVIVEPDDVFGDGVNIATRLEGIADPGQVYISGGIYEQIKHKLVCGYESLGDRKVKNITDPIRVYRVLPDPAAFNRTRKRRENILILLLSLFLLVIASGVLWYVFWQPHGKAGGQASVPVSPEIPKVLPSPPPILKQAAPQTQPAPSVAPAVKQGASPPQLASPSTPATQLTSAVREPEMNMLRGGNFIMGSNDEVTEKPTHQVTIKPFAIGRYPTSVREWNECAAAKACAFVATGKDDAPITNVSWSDAKQFVVWLAGATRKAYRLPSEAEWEYAARGGTQTKYWWGDQFQSGMANCKNCNDIAAAEQPIKVGSFRPNPFGLYDMGGGVDQWVEDCWHKNYQGAPSDGSAWAEGDCVSHVIRSGSWKNDARYARPTNRDSYDTNVRYPTHGLRVALSP
ncbi:SUMF1/EgtB/PvdO family nonheme iron enzyme [Afipia sp. GAS231]|uniref:SUMF1/EgtB/PvdO family nonheme iron enzyme n=1 Tax=Afipia sp. GAS231 TaxID=1882747 RepID=UPI00087B9ABB|nr:SUMF1/EgtB/PvdO family nonheme iron enzyme [Afipia sp. GAS231]SDN10733.1 Formylglycine-generating enzyme, required for sulfatase activity, contains SUMF1/FGE domain [Afipia sp. GAS231]